MFVRLGRLFLLTLPGFLFALSAPAMQEVEVIADPHLPDIAAVQTLPGQDPIIIFNPILCRHAGRALCEFYRYHEYGQIELKHHERDDISDKEKEEEADRWAAMHAPFPVVMAAYRYFSAGGGSTPVHGEGRSRAARLLVRTEQVASNNPGTANENRFRERIRPIFRAMAL